MRGATDGGAARRRGPARAAAAALAAALAAAPAAAGEGLYRDAAPETGLDFVHFNGMTGELYFPEMTGQGGALFDYDGDGDLDAYLVQGALLGPDDDYADALFPPSGPRPPVDRLYRNDLAAGAGGAPRPRFVDVTRASGLGAGGYGMGVAAGDYDGDGRVDLYVTNYGPNQLWRNRGDGTFEDATAASGAGDDSWSTSAAFADLDADGDLDLYVVNYVAFDVADNPRCFAASSRRDYCGPADFPPLPDRLLLNRGDGTFDDAGARLLPGYVPGPGLGVTVDDFDGDGRLDLYVANDGAPNQLWIQGADGTFREDALLAGAALNRGGQAEASMGVSAADFDRDGDPDLFMTHLMGETNTLYVNAGGGLFEDRTVESGLGAASLPYTAFGTGWTDVDNDGWLDLLVLNGAVRILEEQAAAGDPFPLKQPKQLFLGAGGRFREASAEAGEVFAVPEVSRGAAFGDVDNDGDEDVLVTNSNGPARLLENLAGSRAGWLGADPRNAAGAPALGARLAVQTGSGAVLWRRIRTDGSYCSASDPRETVGLGAERPVRLTLELPSGRRVEIVEPAAGRYSRF